MRERRAQIVLLVRSFEEADVEGVLLTHHARTVATRRALMVTGLLGERGKQAQGWRLRLEEAVCRRSRLLFDRLEQGMPGLPRALTAARMGASAAPALLVLALLLGLASNQLGPARRINLLSVPLLALVAWNLGVYAVTAVLALAPGRSLHAGWLSRRLCEVLFRSALWRRLHSFKIADPSGKAESHVLARAVVRFGALWHRVAGALLAARVRRWLHLAAAAMGAGVVGGMYLRGLALEYQVTWESTWLGPAQVQALLGVLLAPASWLLGVPVPAVGPVRAPNAGPAAVWIHLWAATLTLAIVLPRLALAAYQGWRCRMLAARLPVDLDDGYFRRLFTEWRGMTKRVDIMPYSFRPSRPATARLKELLHDFFGARANVRMFAALGYGAEAEDVAPLLDRPGEETTGEADRCLAVLFTLAQPPEVEVQGTFLRDLVAGLDPERQQLLVLVEGSAYRGVPPERITERRQAWDRALGDCGVRPVHVDVGRQGGVGHRASDELIQELRRGLWPAETPARPVQDPPVAS